MLLGRLSPKRPIDKERVTIDYSDFLADTERLVQVSPSFKNGDVELLLTGMTISTDGKSFSIFVSGGTAGFTYRIIFVVTTSGSQIKQDELDVSVADA